MQCFNFCNFLEKLYINNWSVIFTLKRDWTCLEGQKLFKNLYACLRFPYALNHVYSAKNTHQT